VFNLSKPQKDTCDKGRICAIAGKRKQQGMNGGKQCNQQMGFHLKRLLIQH
jgi:hypothetical protein